MTIKVKRNLKYSGYSHIFLRESTSFKDKDSNYNYMDHTIVGLYNEGKFFPNSIPLTEADLTEITDLMNGQLHGV